MKRPVVFVILLTSSIVLMECKDNNTVGREAPPLTMNCETPFPLRTGYATYYTWANGGGNCMFDPTPHDLMVGAMNAADYAGSAACGSCVKITGPRGEVVVRIVDQCGDCPQGNIDLSPQAFERIAEVAQGRVPITWQYVACDVQGNIIYHFKDGSNPWWTAVQVRNHRYPIVRLEYLTSSGTFRAVTRTEYNYFVEPNGMGPGPYTFRVTDVYGRLLVDSGIPHVENGDIPGAGQFPPCHLQETKE